MTVEEEDFQTEWFSKCLTSLLELSVLKDKQFKTNNDQKIVFQRMFQNLRNNFIHIQLCSKSKLNNHSIKK